MEQNTAYAKRFSEHISFWLLCGAAAVFLHLFFYLRIRSAFSCRFADGTWLVWSIIMLLSPLAARSRAVIGSGRLRRWTDRVGGVWMIFVLIAFLICLLFSFIGYLINVAFSDRVLLVISFMVAALVVSLGVRQANMVEPVYIDVPTEKLGNRTLRVVQLTDLHLGPWTGRMLLEQVVEKINSAKPDLVVVTGDLADGRLSGRENETMMLRKISAPLGVFAVTGNHDYYDSLRDSLAFMESAGMKVLRTEAVEVGGILLAGVDDRDHLIKEKWNLSRSETLVLSLERVQREKFLLLLRHRPIVELGTQGHFDLQLSGHTHGGQLFPYLTSRHIFVGHDRGLKKLRCGGYLYVSNGAGYVGPPVRLLAPAEIAVFDIGSRH